MMDRRRLTRPPGMTGEPQLRPDLPSSFVEGGNASEAGAPGIRDHSISKTLDMGSPRATPRQQVEGLATAGASAQPDSNLGHITRERHSDDGTFRPPRIDASPDEQRVRLEPSAHSLDSHASFRRGRTEGHADTGPPIAVGAAPPSDRDPPGVARDDPVNLDRGMRWACGDICDSDERCCDSQA
jgi:hypothetical protein